MKVEHKKIYAIELNEQEKRLLDLILRRDISVPNLIEELHGAEDAKEVAKFMQELRHLL